MYSLKRNVIMLDFIPFMYRHAKTKLYLQCWVSYHLCTDTQ